MMVTNPLVSSLIRATSSIAGGSRVNTTPLQRTIIQSRRYQQCTSIRYILVILSATYLLGCLSYCCYIVISTYHFHTNNTFISQQQQPQTSSSSSSSSVSILKYFKDKNNRRVHFFYWDDQDENQDASLQSSISRVGSTSAQLSTAAFANKAYYPWNMFTTNIKDNNYNRIAEDTAVQDANEQPPQNNDQYDDDLSSTNNDDNDDDNTMQQPSLAQHLQKHKKAKDQESTTSTTNTKTDKNPAIYGWTPHQYPNPILDPVHCAVSYILPHLQQQSPPTNINDAVATIPMNSTHQTNHAVSLRLCDPDWVLGGVYLEQVAMALYNFSTLFGIQHSVNENADDESGTAAAEAKSTSASAVTMESPTITNNDRMTDSQLPKEDNWNVQVGPSNRRRSLRSDVYRSSLLPDRNNVAASRRTTQSSATTSNAPRIELAVATVRKMNIPLVLRQENANTNYNSNNYYSTYENDDDELVNDAAQIFARAVHDDWWSSSVTTTTAANSTAGHDVDWFRDNAANQDDASDENPADYGILLFLSVQDRVCFISTGSSISVTILPWWRLDHIVTNMKPYLQSRNYGIAILHAVHDISNMLLTGPPTLSDRIHDFVSRFGIVIAFAAFTFCFGAWGEYRDRRKRWQHAEQSSKLTSVERQKAQQLQMEFRTRCCPICLENYDYGDTLPNDMQDEEEYSIPIDAAKPLPSTNSLLSLLGDPRKGVVDEYGIPRRGADGRKIKLLRCGHLFCETCWRSWVHSTACGSPCSCPVCRQDVGKNVSRNRRSQSVPALSTIESSDQDQSDLIAGPTSNYGAQSTSTRTTLPRNTQSYDSFADQNRAVASNARIVRVNTMLRGAILFRQTSAFVNRSTDYVVEESNADSVGQVQPEQRERDENTPLLSR